MVETLNLYYKYNGNVLKASREGYLNTSKLEVKGTASDLDRFADKSLIAAYAVNGVASVVKEGLIVGSGERINPLGNTTRAEAAAFLYRIYNK